MPPRILQIFLIAIWTGTAAGVTFLVVQDNNSPSGYVNTVGNPLPTDAAPPEYQVMTRFERDNQYMDRGTSTYKQAFGVALVNEPLTRVDKDFNLNPAAATHWEVADDNLTWTYHIKEGLIFSDGHPLTAYDYEATFQRWADPETGFDFEWYFRSIRNWADVVAGRVPVDSVGVHALNDTTLVFITSRPTPYLPLLLNKSWVTPKHLFDKYGPEWATRPETHKASGPYRLLEWRKTDRIVLVPNDTYRGPEKPMLERVVVKLFNNAVTPQFLPAYEAGEVDYIPLENQAEINRVKSDPMLQDQLNAYVDFSTYYLMMDTYNPPFDDIRVRQAFGHAIEQAALIKSALRSIGLPATSMMPPGFPAANPEGLASLQAYDPEQARTLLAEAGYPNGKGFPSVDIWLRQETPVIRTAAEAVQAMLRQNLNINVGVSNVERKVFLDAMSSRQLTLGMVPYQYDYIDAGNLLTIWLSNGRHAWHNDRFENLVLQANQLVGEPERRIAMYQDAEQILVGEAGGIFLWYILINQMWKPYIKGGALEPNRWGYRAWRGDLMSNLSSTLYVTNDVLKGRAKPRSGSLWQRILGN